MLVVRMVRMAYIRAWYDYGTKNGAKIAKGVSRREIIVQKITK